MKRLCRLPVFLCLWLHFGPLASGSLAQSSGSMYPFNIPAQPADKALVQLAKQAGIVGLLAYDEVRGVMTNKVSGVYTVKVALGRMLANTGLEAEVNEHGVLIARLRQAPIQAQAQAQEAKTEEDISTLVSLLEEVVVTARRREENLMDIPVAITAFTGTDLKARQIDQIHQVGNATPNLIWRRQSDTSNAGATVHIRGVGQDFGSAVRQPGVGLYMDGVYLSQASSALMDVMDIQSIEVLRGPQGTLFGRNTIGGAVQITTAKPNDKFGGEIDLLVGDYSRHRIKGTVNIPFSDTFFAKFSASWQEKNGFVKTPFISGDDGKGGDDNTTFRAAFRWLATEDLTFDLAMDYSEHESGGPPSVLAAPINEFTGTPDPMTGLTGILTVDYNNVAAPALGLPLALNRDFFVSPKRYTSNQAPNPSFGPGISDPSVVGSNSLDQRSEWQSISFTANWDINEHLAFKSITNYREQESESIIDLDELPVPIGASGDLKDGDQFSQELQLSGTAFNDRLNWVTGLYYFQEEVEAINPADFPTFHIVSGAIADNTSTAVFGQLTYDVTDKLSLTLGIRNTDEELESIVDDNIHYVLSSLSGPTVPANFLIFPTPPAPGSTKIVPNGTFETEANETEPYLNVAYDFTDSLMAYVSYSEGFKSGGFTQSIAPGLTVESFDPEFVEVYEVGIKWSAERVRITAAWFYTNYTDLQVNTNRELGGSTENAANAVIQGGEIELMAALTERLQVTLGVGYLDGKYEDVDSAVVFSEDNRLPNVMDWQVNASISYRYPIGPGELISRLDYSFTDDYFVEAENQPELLMGSYSLLNASLTYVHESDKWEVSLQGTNITDEFYTTFSVGSSSTEGYSTITLGPPAEWSVRFAYRFGE